MPYIDKGRRGMLDYYINDIAVRIKDDPGELNYVISALVKRHVGESPRYADYNRALGALFAASLEFYREAVAPYEDVKMLENGEVY